MANQLHTALVGCGGISGAHLPNIRNTPEMRLVATMDVFEAAAQRRAEEIGAAYYTTDWQRILDDDTIEAVLLCSTHNTHTALAIEALAAGKHVYSEKPLAMTLDEARRLQQAVHESGLQLMSGWWFKHSPVTKRLREVISQPYFILFTCRLASSRYDNARPNDPEGPYGRNGILDAAGYNLHWIWHVMRSQPVEVTATGYEGVHHEHQYHHHPLRQRQYRHLDLQRRGRRWHPAEALCRGAGWRRSAPPPCASAISSSKGTDEPGIKHNTYHNGFDEEMGMFAHLCLHGGPSPMDAWEACIPTLIFEKAVESMRTHQPVPVDVREEFYLPDGKLPASIEHFGD